MPGAEELSTVAGERGRPSGALGVPATASEFRAERLRVALRGLAAELVEERRKVLALRREVADLKSRIAAVKEPSGDAGRSDP